MAIEQFGKITYDDINKLKNTSIETGSIECSTLNCTGQLTVNKIKHTKSVTSVYSSAIPPVSTEVTFDVYLNSFNFTLFCMQGHGFPLLWLPSDAFTFMNSSANRLLFQCPDNNCTISLHFPDYGKKMVVDTNTLGGNPVLSIFGISFFV